MFKMRGQMNKGKLLTLLTVAIFSGAIALNADEKDASISGDEIIEISEGTTASFGDMKNILSFQQKMDFMFLSISHL
jgi:hypothetical protein